MKEDEEILKEIAGSIRKEEATIYESLLQLIILLKDIAIVCDKVDGKVTILKRST